MDSERKKPEYPVIKKLIGCTNCNRAQIKEEYIVKEIIIKNTWPPFR